MKNKVLNILLCCFMTLIFTGCVDIFFSKNIEHVQKLPENIDEQNELDDITTTTTTMTTTTSTTTKKKIQKLICNNNDFFGNGDNVIYKGEFTFENGKINRYEYTLIVPEKYDPEDYYVQEQIGNMGRYQMSLEGRKIINILTPDWSYWNDWPHNNKSIEEIRDVYEDSTTKCEIIG